MGDDKHVTQTLIPVPGEIGVCLRGPLGRGIGGSPGREIPGEALNWVQKDQSELGNEGRRTAETQGLAHQRSV